MPLELHVYNIKYMLHVFCKQQYEKTPGYKHILDIQLNTVEILLVWLFSETTASNSMYIIWYIPLILVSIPPLYFIFVT